MSDAGVEQVALGQEACGRFIVGTGKCGSTLLSTLVGSHPAVLSISELFTALQPAAFPRGTLTGVEFWNLLSQPKPLWTMALRDGIEPKEFLYSIDGRSRFTRASGIPPIAAICLPAISGDADSLYAELEAVVPRFSPAAAPDQYRQLFAWLTRRYEKTVWVERSGGSLSYAGELVRAFPNARFLHLYRRGAETAFRLSRHPFFRMDLIRDMLKARIGVDPYFDLTGTLGNTMELLPGSHRAETLENVNLPIQRFGIRWSATILRGTTALGTLQPGKVANVCYESLVDQPEAELTKILAFFEIPNASPEWMTHVASRIQRRPDSVEDLPRPELERIERACSVGEARLRLLEAEAQAVAQ
jgi:hypothetical protein